jgi:diaminopimelate epimerase
VADVDGIAFAKGHGTRNDFVLLPDADAGLELTASRVSALCDRREGLGADGVLRLVRSEHADPGLDVAGAEWFMDYRNADGSKAAMCGNGIRVFVQYLREEGLLAENTADEVAVATRGGVRQVRVADAGGLSVAMGSATTPMLRAIPRITVGKRTWPATGVLLPNPHAVVLVDSLDDAGDLSSAPLVDPGSVFPDGVNVEFVVGIAPDHLTMRVHERGVGETQSCGTGACAAAWAWRRRGDLASAPATVRVDVPGGTLWVTEDRSGEILLRGPAAVVARGQLSDSWWEEH